MSNNSFRSPLRYPGGKGTLSVFLEELLCANNITGTYCEVYAGGAGAALNLLFEDKVNMIVLNDADYHIYCFWKSILYETKLFIETLRNCPITMDEWTIQRTIYNSPDNYTDFEIGFSTFYLNRCNRGGILPGAGPIGGFEQLGNYSIGARFNKENLISRILNIANRRQSIAIYNLDALDFIELIRNNLDPANTFIYLDPPYFQQGKNLYLNFYNEMDHQLIEQSLSNVIDFKWLVSYDNVEQIRSIYSNYRVFPFNLNYSIQIVKKGKELMIFSDELILPKYFTLGKNKEQLICL